MKTWRSREITYRFCQCSVEILLSVTVLDPENDTGVDIPTWKEKKAVDGELTLYFERSNSCFILLEGCPFHQGFFQPPR